MKRSVEGFNQFNSDEAKPKIKLQSLLNEFLLLQKEVVSKKRKLQAAKQRRDNSLGEILFLKQRRRHLLKSKASNVDSERMKIFHTESEVPGDETFDSNDAAAEIAHHTFTPNFNSGYDGGDKELKDVVSGKDMLRLECASENYLIDDNRVGKKKFSWHDQIKLPVQLLRSICRSRPHSERLIAKLFKLIRC